MALLSINNFILALSNFRCHLHGRRVGKKICLPCTNEYFFMVTCNSPCNFKSTVILDASAKEVESVRHACETGYSLVFYVFRSEASALQQQKSTKSKLKHRFHNLVQHVTFFLSFFKFT